MFRKQDVIALLAGVVAAWPMASEAITCSANKVHKISFSGGSNVHSCISLGSGTVLAEILTEEHPGKVTLTVRPQGCTGPACGGDDATTTSATEPMVEALLVCKNKKSTCLVKIPASIPQFSNTTSTTVARTDHPELFTDEDEAIGFLTTLSANPAPMQLLMLKRFCPGCNRKGKPVNYLSLNIKAILAFETGQKFDMTATGGNCTINFGNLTVNPAGEFNRISYAGGCDPVFGNEKDPPPCEKC